MKRRVAPRSLTALIVAVLVAGAVMPGAAVAETPAAPSPDSTEAPTPEDDQSESPSTPAPEATPTPAPTGSTPTKPTPGDEAPADEKPSPTPSATNEEPDADRDDSSTPADSDVMPVSPLQRCIAVSLDGQEATFARTKKLTEVEVDPTCALPAGTLDPDDLPAMDDWDGAEFLPGVTTLTVTGFDGVIVPKDGLKDFAKLESASLPGNLLTELPDLGTLPELTSLDLSANKFTELSVPTAEDVPQLAELDVRKNQISDVTGASDAAAALTITATDQTLTHPAITARATQQLAGVITVPDAWTDPSWEPGENQMAAVNGDAGTFSAARPGAWSLSWTLSEGKVSYSGSTTGDATAPEPEPISFTKPGPVAVGESATYRADVSNLPAAVRSELDYQWYRGPSTSELKPVDGATEQKFTIDSVAPEDDGSFVKLVATADGAAHQSVPALLAAQLDFEDEGFERCLDKRFPGGYDEDDLAALRSLDCSGQGIQVLDDLAMIDPDGNVSFDLSDNLITDLSLLVSGDGLNRDKQVNLSDNQISDVSDLADVDLSDAPANLIVLDGNRISSVSGLGDVEFLATSGPAPISVRRQEVDVLEVGERAEVGQDVLTPQATSVSNEALPLTQGANTVTDDETVKFSQQGVGVLTWAETTTHGVAFSGDFVVPVGTGTLLGLRFSSSPATGGDTVSVRGYGFVPDEEVTLRDLGDKAPFNGTTELTVTADEDGAFSTTFILTYKDDTYSVEARGESNRFATAGTFTVINDDQIVPVPDDALSKCIEEKVGPGPDDDSFYGSQLDRITADFSCRNEGVEDLTGLDEIPSPSIDLASNDVASLNTVPALNDATTSLDLTNNELGSLGTVVNQPRLRDLNLSQNRLKDLSALDDKMLAEGAEIVAVGQTITLDQRVVGERTDVPAVAGLGKVPAKISFPDGRETDDDDERSYTWSEAGDQRIDFALRQESRPDEDDDPEEPDEAQAPGLELAGSFLIRVENAPPVVQPPSDPPAQQAPPAAAVQTLAPASLVERIEPEDDDEEEEPPQAVALGPEVALQETSPTPRVVTNPTVEKREPITSMSGWGLTATGWSLLGAALLAMALAVGIAVLTLGRSTR